ncbi:low-specificity L-threonine aldolase [Billgrantia kenyensis]|uniref:Low-specificity L-threonine aldolase n=1 Tax=Billgrantia kenyensis TaxID=321266 RepID=A0A7V9W148_9GAMM|nr:low-specificity L-threonine aldolase [Halomonas kenyensis]MBA2779131.1 low-specificity L-threonine aldolase [Halomonas kenyensis]MCG6660558.1 low-specificity L-threonine aldolase [Halomonas kenyensis]
MIDLRSDTVTRPSAAMREAMVRAEVGDDVWGDDPTVKAFEQAVAERAGKAAALFLPSGTQSNLCALLTHCQRGEEVIAGQYSHIFRDEGGGAAALGSVAVQPLPHQADGSLALDALHTAVKGDDIHHARSRLLALENTYRGMVMPRDYTLAATAQAHEQGLATHLDGARLFNASVATGLSLATLCEGFDSVSLCFSKGLGAPVGSLLLGEGDFIAHARRWRKTLGGGMRQAGLLAAACHYAFEHHVDRLIDDHDNARRLAEGLAAVPGVEVRACDTNMVFVAFPQAHCQALQAHLEARGILVAVGQVTRLVTHLDVTTDAVERVVSAVSDYFSEAGSELPASTI